MKLLFSAIYVLFVVSLYASAGAASRTEEQFVQRASATLLARYPTTAQAIAHGYVKMRNLDKDNTIIYTNFDFQRVTGARPNFLWYNRTGALVGVDYEFPTARFPTPPLAAYPVPKSRWVIIPEHVHFAYTLNGKTVRHGGPALPNLKHGALTLDALQKDKLVPSGAKLLWATYHPATWDLGFWVVPNPAGPFAAHNTLVK